MRKLIAVLVTIAAIAAAPASAATKAQVKAAIRQVFGPGRAPQATCIAYAESRLNNGAVSKTGDHGEFQINAATWFGNVARWAKGPPGYRAIYVMKKYIYNPVYNAKVAYVISHGGSNWGPWSTYTRLGLCH